MRDWWVSHNQTYNCEGPGITFGRSYEVQGLRKWTETCAALVGLDVRFKMFAMSAAAVPLTSLGLSQ